MGRLVLYTYEQPRGEVVKCSKCRLEASSLTLVRGECAACREEVPPDEIATPDEGLRKTICACGCGTSMFIFDANGNRRTYLNKDHFRRHRRELALKRGKKIRVRKRAGKPDRRQEKIECKCGCGTTFNRFDCYNEPREYFSRLHQKKHEMTLWLDSVRRSPSPKGGTGQSA